MCFLEHLYLITKTSIFSEFEVWILFLCFKKCWEKLIYSETRIQRTAWGGPNLFVKSGVRNNQEINSLR
jgi:hypothetical protein